jgi:peptidyl-prolyl cis-trans isomerase C
MRTQPKTNWLWITLLFITFLPAPTSVAAEKKLPEGALAIVNGVTIPLSELDNAIDQVRQQAQLKGERLDQARMPEIKRMLTDRLIQQELLYQESRRQGIVVETASIEEQIGKMRDRFSSDAEFKQALVKIDTTLPELRVQVERRLAVQGLLDREILKKVQITAEESKAFYDNNPNYFKEPDQVRARHILIKVDPEADEADLKKARQKIEAIEARLQAGEDFAKLARELSEGPSATKGGDLGFFDRRQMVKPFADAAFALKPGEISGVVQTRFGYHLITVEERKPESKIPYAEVKDRLEQSLKQQKAEKMLNTYLETLKAQATIVS